MIQNIFRRQPKSLTFEELRIVQLIVLQVVLALELSVCIPIDKKQELAILQSGEILEDMKLSIPQFLVKIAVEAALGNICAYSLASGST